MPAQEEVNTMNNSEVPETESPSTQPKGGKFEPGQSGNPNGRPKGSRNKSTLAREKIDIAAVLDVVQEQALAGDRASQRLLLELVVPRAKYPTVSFDLPEKIDTPEALAEASAEIVQQIADGNIPPEQARILMSLLKDHWANVNPSASEAKLVNGPQMVDGLEVPQIDYMELAARGFKEDTGIEIKVKPKPAAT